MDTPPNTPTLGNRDQGPARGRGEWLPPLASPCEAQVQAAPVGDQDPFSPGVPLRANEIWGGFGLRAQGGDFRLWDEVPAWQANQGWARGLGVGQDPGGGGELQGDRGGGDDEVRHMWTLDAVNEGIWDDIQDTTPYWD